MTLTKFYRSIALAVFLLFSGCQKPTVNLIQYVNPLIGTGPTTSTSGNKFNQGSEKWGQDIPAVSTPFGMTQWTPETREAEDKSISPYYYGGSRINGFRGSHWHSASSRQDYGSFTIMPITGFLSTFANERASGFAHETETSTPAYYSCMLLNYLTFVEMTGTARSGFFKFSYAQKDKGFILITPNSSEGKGYINVDPEKREIYGYNPVHGISPGFEGLSGYFVVRFNRPFDNYGCYFQMEDLKKQTEISGKPDIGAYAEFDIKERDVILAKVGTSFTSIESARANLDAEIPHWNFQETKTATERIWNESLSSIKLKGGKNEDYTKFYTAMYHSLLYPHTFSNVDGTYPDFTGNKLIRKVEKGHDYFGDISMDNAQSAQLSLVKLVAPDKFEDIQKSVAEKAGNIWMPDSVEYKSYIPYQFDQKSDPVETQKNVKNILANDYTCYDGGIPGNDLSGQLSAWYVFSAMGFYPDLSGTGEYQLSSPIFSEIDLNLNTKYYPGGKFKFTLDDENTYKTFNHVELNGKSIPFVITHENIKTGGTLKFSNK